MGPAERVGEMNTPGLEEGIAAALFGGILGLSREVQRSDSERETGGGKETSKR